MLYQMGPEIDTSEKDLRFEKKKKKVRMVDIFLLHKFDMFTSLKYK